MNSKNCLNEKKIAAILIFVAVIVLIFVLMIALFEDNTNSYAKHTNKEISEKDNDENENHTFPADDARNLSFKSLGYGKCSVSGIGTFEGTQLEIPSKNRYGETVVGIEKSAFEGCDGLEYVFIPSTVQNIGEKAFKGCSALREIKVSANNSKFCSQSGILFSKSLSTLICYPPAKPNSSFLIREETKSVSDYAFEGAVHLKELMYEGTTSDFEKIQVGGGNARFYILPITCNYS